MSKAWITALLGTGMLAGAACSGSSGHDACRSSQVCVDCRAVCERMVECQVDVDTGGTPAPPWQNKDTPQDRCERSCVTTDTITPERERCIEDADPADAEGCQRHIVECLGVDGGTQP